MAQIKYVDDYIPYLKEKYPFLTEEALQEAVEDGFEIIRKSLVKPRDIVLSRKESVLFEEKELYGAFIMSTIFKKKYRGKIIRRINKQREKNEKDN